MTDAFRQIIHFRQQLERAGVSRDDAHMIIRAIMDYHHTTSERAKLRVINSLPSHWEAAFKGNEVEIHAHEKVITECNGFCAPVQPPENRT